MPVLAVGGIFLRAQHPDDLSTWYRTHLGIGAGLAAPGTDPADEWTWTAQGGPLVFAPFPVDTDYWPVERQVMLNLRVSDLDGLIASLRAAGVDVVTDAAWDSAETGRFARIHDPEGNPIELWEPPAG
jgi:hypothetical protein